MLSETFSPNEHILAGLLIKEETDFPYLYSRVSSRSYFGICKKRYFSETLNFLSPHPLKFITWQLL